MRKAVCAVACLFVVAGSWAAGGFKVEEKVLGKASEKSANQQVRPSLAEGHEMYTVAVGAQKVAVVDGLAGPTYDDVADHFAASPDGRVAYRAKKGGKWIAVVNGHEGHGYDEFRDGPWFIGGGKRVEYTARKGQKWVVVIDGVESAEYGKVGYSCSSLDGSRVAYPAMKGEKWVLVDGKQESKEYDEILSSAVSENGKHVAYAGLNDGSTALVVDGVEKPWGAGSDIIALSPDGTRVAGVICLGGTSSDTGKPIRAIRPQGEWAMVMVVDGERGKEYSGISSMPPEFRHDGTAFGYVAKRGGKHIVVVNGEEGPEYDEINAPTLFSPEGHRTGYSARKGDQWVAVVDGVEGPKYDSVQDIRWVAGGKHFHYWARKGGMFVMVVDGAEMAPRRDEIEPWVFTPNGEHWACQQWKRTGTKWAWAVVVDGKESPEYDGSLAFYGGIMLSPDGKTVAFATNRGEKWVMVVNGAEGPEYDRIVSGMQHLNPDGAVEYRAVKGGQVYSVKQSPE